MDLAVNINKYTPQRVGSYLPLPPAVQRKQACINVKNVNDDACFAWGIVSALYPAKTHVDRTSSYPYYEDVLNLEGITFPIQRSDIKKFEKLNNISINVYVMDEKYKCFPNRLTKKVVERHVNLLLVQDPNDHTKCHYVWIKDLSRLVAKQLSMHKNKKFFCDRCLHYFYSETKLQKHSVECCKVNDCKVSFPNEKVIKFKNFKNKLTVPFAIYADFECLLCPNNDHRRTHKHVPYSVGYYFKCSYDNELSYYRSFRGVNCVQWFVQELQQLAEDIETVHWCPVPMDKLSGEQYSLYYRATKCHICERPIGQDRVRDHCHLTGKFRGAAHAQCNLDYQITKTIPTIFHNLSGYDGHLLVEELAGTGNLRVLPNNTEQYISMTYSFENNEVKFKFIDSFRFMASSLDKLASYLEEYPILESRFDRDVSLLKRKGVFPYCYVSCWEKLQDIQLPSIEAFYSDLTNASITERDYVHAQSVWQEFQCRNLGEYSDLYLKTDVLLLADVFENFRKNCLHNYGLDAAHYYTAPGLAWDVMLKTTEVELDTLQDVDMLLFIEKGIRGGMTQCSARYAKANNQYMSEHDPTAQNIFLMYYDINAMYSWAMSQYLPYGGLKWVEDCEHVNFNIPDDNTIGYILEVDLEYPESIHDRQSDLPMAPEKGKPPGNRQEKMLATLQKKEKYVLHYRNLKQYLAEGIVLSKIHRVLEFNQSNWLKSYIELNTILRQNAKNDFEKNLFKLMNNAVFGKTMENVRLRRDIKIVGKWEGRYGADALISKPNFKCRTIFNDNLAAIELSRTEVVFDKPIYVGMCVLDISKTILYEFHYAHMKNVYGDKCKLCYTDTDSLIYAIETHDIYEDMKQNINRFDTSDYPSDNLYNLPQVNKKVPGLMKDEGAGKLLLEFVGLRAKMYACKYQDSNIIKKAKGVQGSVLIQQILFEDYVKCLLQDNEVQHNQRSIRSFSHTLYTTNQTKITLSPYDDKRFRLPGFTDTLPWGHYSIPQ